MNLIRAYQFENSVLTTARNGKVKAVIDDADVIVTPVIPRDFSLRKLCFFVHGKCGFGNQESEKVIIC